MKVVKNITKITGIIMLNKCPKCNHSQIIKRGGRESKNRGWIQRYTCKRCDYHFTDQGKCFRMRNRRWKIDKALEMRKQGNTYAQIAEAVGDVSRTTVLRWIQTRLPPAKKWVVVTREVRYNSYGKKKKYKRKFNIKI